MPQRARTVGMTGISKAISAKGIIAKAPTAAVL